MASDVSSAASAPSNPSTLSSPSTPSSPPAAPSAAPSKPEGSPPASVGPSAAEKSNPALLASRGVDGFDGAKPAGPVSLGASFEKKTKVESGPFSLEGSIKTGVSADRRTDVSAGKDGPTALDKKSVTLKEDQAVTAGVTVGKLGVTASVGSGSDLKVETAMPAGVPGRADPRDPDGMPVGSKVTFTATGRDTEGSGVSLTEKLGKDVSASAGFSDSVTLSKGVTFSAQKVNDHTIRVSEGGVDGVSDAFGGNASLKLGKASVSLGLGSTNAETDQHLQTLEFDLHNPAARQAYTDLVAGRAGLPAADAAKGIRAGSVDSFSVTQDSALSVEAKLGSFGIQPGKIPLGSAAGVTTLTRAADQTASLTHSLRFGNETFSVDRAFGADGVEDVSKRKFNFLVSGADKGVSPQFLNIAQVFGNHVANSFAQGTNDFQLSFTQAQLQQLKDLAGSPAMAGRTDRFIRNLAQVKTGDLKDVFRVMGMGNDAAFGLAALAGGTRTPIPGTMFLRSQDNGGMTIQLR